MLSKEKIKWTNARAKLVGGYITSEPIITNKRADVFYRKALDKEFNKYVSKVLKEVEKSYTVIKVDNSTKTPLKASRDISVTMRKFEKIFLGNSFRLISKWLKIITKDGRKSIDKTLSQFTGKDISIKFNRQYETVLKLLIKENVSLIKNTTSQFNSNVESIVTINMTQGANWKQASKELKEQYGISDRRLKRIARDQTAKATQSLNEISQRDAGAEFWEWRTSKDERVSTGYGGHKQLQGKIYRYDEPENDPVIDSYGNTGKPSKRVNCRCTSVAVWILDGFKPVKQSDGSYLVVKG